MRHYLALAARVAVSVLCALACAELAGACDASSGSGPSINGGAGFANSTSDAGTDAGDAGPAPTLSFQPSTTVTLEPKATRTLTVATSPPSSYKVRFALLGSGTNTPPGDAALDTSEVDTDSSGIARVTLTAPSTPTTFSVRASVAKAQTQIGVSVSARNYTTLRVLPSYNGKRTITEWTATTSAGVTCAKLMGNPPADGDLSITASRDRDLDIVQVPVGVALAVTLRAGHYVGGCADHAALSETDGNTVLVYASDRPLNLDATTLDLGFGPTEPSAALVKLMSSGATLAESALSNGGTSDVVSLLDAMREATPTASRDAFSAARLAHAWDNALGAAFGPGAATRLRDPAARWLNAGLARFFAADTFSTQLAAAKSGALLSLNAVAQLPAASAGFPSSFPATWTADSNDTLLIGTQLSWVPSRLLTALAVLPATLEFPGAVSAEAALAQSVDCTLVGKTLVAHGTVVGSAAYEGCDQACTSTACATAVSALWKRAGNASGTTSATLTVTGTGAAAVADDASVASLTGSWVGQLQIGPDTADASGPISATAAAE